MCPDTVSSATNFGSVPGVLRQLTLQVEHLLDEGLENRFRTHPPKIRSRADNSVVMWNIFPDHPDQLNGLYKEIEHIIDSFLADIKGEVIKLEVHSGTIHDMGVQEFHVKQGNTWDVYLYEAEDFLYFRLFHEARDHNHEEWLSLDIDLITESAWFVD